MNKQRSQTRGSFWTGSSLQKQVRAVLNLVGICGLAIFLIAFSIHADLLEAKSAIIQNPAAQLRVASAVPRTESINTTGPESVFHARKPAAGLPPVPEASTGVQMLAGLAFLIWIQRLRRYWV